MTRSNLAHAMVQRNVKHATKPSDRRSIAITVYQSQTPHQSEALDARQALYRRQNLRLAYANQLHPVNEIEGGPTCFGEFHVFSSTHKDPPVSPRLRHIAPQSGETEQRKSVSGH
jgi:hypothetical protein